jgi:hypothetical protein
VDTLVLGVWLPLCDTTSALGNGQVQMMPAGRNERHVLQHYQAPSYLVVDQAELQAKFTREPVTCEVPLGSFVLFNSFTPHRSLANSSDKARFSFDLRYQDARSPHGMGKNGGLVQLRSADPLFSVDWAEGPLGPPIPPDKNGVTPPQWPSAGRDFSPETAGHQPRALRPLASASRGGVLAAVRHAGERERAARRAGANRTGAVG